MTLHTHIETVPNGLGSQFQLPIHRFGIPGGRPRIYLQAALHTEELPGALVLHHLKEMLSALPAEDWLGEAVLVPFANPIGLSQAISGNPVGRLELASGTNFNMGWPLSPVEPGAETAAWLAETTALTGMGGLRLALLRAAFGADIILDLHCSMEPAVAFAFVAEEQGDAASVLAAALALDLVLTLPPVTGSTFTDAAASLGPARLIATLELRGHRDLSDAQARTDAGGLLAYLRQSGILRGSGAPLPTWQGLLAPYDSAIALPALAGGIFLPRARIRDVVATGDLLAEILLAVPDGKEERIAVHAPCKAMVLSHADPARLLYPGLPSHVILPLEPPPAPLRGYVDFQEEWA